MENKICVITGCNSGIGKVTAIELAKMGFEIIMLVRDSQKSRDAFNEIKRESGSDQVALKYVDLSSLESIKNVAEEINGVTGKYFYKTLFTISLPFPNIIINRYNLIFNIKAKY
jgi:NAD(P)-dependent dehydrogenase (short-subunit alcohol dehydrogenase family)